MFYAIQWTYGRACDSDGDRIGRYYRFGSARDRDKWCDATSAELSSSSGWRDPIPASDPELRREIKKGADGRIYDPD